MPISRSTAHPRQPVKEGWVQERCDGVIYQHHTRHYVVCNRVLGRADTNAPTEVVEVTCSKCGKVHMLPRAQAQSDTAA